jgi:hypothetical protein
MPMVMQNGHDGANTPNWWDDLPPGLRKRFTNTSRPEPRHDPDEDDASSSLRRVAGTDPSPYRPGVFRDLSRLVMLFLVVALANLLFLLIALAFLTGNRPLGH